MGQPHNYRDLTGLRIEAMKLVVLERAGETEAGHVLWKCRRDNGREILRTGSYLLGYRPKGYVGPRHGPKRPPKRYPELNAWHAMIARCTKPSNPAYSDYGGRGIRVCRRWLKSYRAFLKDMGPRPGPGYSLERKRVNGHYTPSNCCWATRREQNRNTRANRRLTYQGVTLTVIEWAERLDMPAHTIRSRLDQELPLAEVLKPGRRPAAKGARGPNGPRTGYSQTPEHRAWKAMVQRCTNPKHPSWRRYGGRGITVCSAWQDSFLTFLADMGQRPGPGYSLERERVNEGYGPDNCRWATRLEQARNTRRTIFLTHQGERLSVPDWAERIGVKPVTIRARLKMGWPIERVLAPKHIGI